MICQECHHGNPAGAQFCGQCGARLEARCSTCHASNPGANRFCHQCGTELVKGSRRDVEAVAAYTPRHLAEKILKSRSAVEGERKHVSVLFCDVANSTPL